jgi:lysophospholipase L1-like esterase
MRRHAIGTVVVVLAVSGAACSRSESPTSPTPGGNTVAYTVLGASDGIGFGSSVVCAPFDLGCENGMGYAQVIRRRWQGEGKTVSYVNLSVPGAVLSPAIASLAVQLGRSDPGNFVDRYPPFVPTTTTHITIFAGGNDANVIGSAVGAGAGASDIRGYVDTHVRQWGTDLAELVSRIRSRAPNARIVAYNLPNLAGAPYLSSRSLTERGIMQRIATGLADQVNALGARNVIVVDLMCDARVLQASSFSADGFHPSDAGYGLMAELGFPALANGSAPAPQASCATRTVVPPY